MGTRALRDAGSAQQEPGKSDEHPKCVDETEQEQPEPPGNQLGAEWLDRTHRCVVAPIGERGREQPLARDTIGE